MTVMHAAVKSEFQVQVGRFPVAITSLKDSRVKPDAGSQVTGVDAASVSVFRAVTAAQANGISQMTARMAVTRVAVTLETETLRRFCGRSPAALPAELRSSIAVAITTHSCFG
jgi:hypothetical protein